MPFHLGAAFMMVHRLYVTPQCDCDHAESSIEFFTEDIMELEVRKTPFQFCRSGCQRHSGVLLQQLFTAQETVRSLESKLRDVQLALAQEKEALPKVWDARGFHHSDKSLMLCSLTSYYFTSDVWLAWQMEAVVKACCAQHAHLSFLAENLPAHLPGQQGGHSQPQQLRGSGSGAADSYLDASSNGENDASHANTSRPNSADCLGDKKKRPPAPRW